LTKCLPNDKTLESQLVKKYQNTPEICGKVCVPNVFVSHTILRNLRFKILKLLIRRAHCNLVAKETQCF